MRRVREVVPLEIEMSAVVLRGLGNLEDWLAFPEGFVETHVGYLRCIAGYTNGALMPWEPEWGRDLRKTGIREVAKVVMKGLSGGKATSTSGDIPEKDRELVKEKVLAYEAVCGVNFGCSMRSLWIEMGARKEEGLFKLVQIDKSTVTMPFVQGWIKRAQHLGDWAFFEGLGKAIAAPPLNSPLYMYGAVLLTAGFWDEYFAERSYPETVGILEELELLPRGKVDPKSFAKTLNRYKLRKSKHSRHKLDDGRKSATSDEGILSQS